MSSIDFARNMPKDGIAGLQQNWKTDLMAGFMVFLIALPLCLGISIASGFPPIAGVFTAIIGGMVVSIIGSARLTIKGPAAGLIAIAIASVDELGALAKHSGNLDVLAGYKLTLAVIVVASLLQVAFGFMKAGNLGDFFPSSVVHGMLAAIGIIIFAKQFPILLGVKPTVKEPLELLGHIPSFMAQANPAIMLIGLISLAILFTLPLFKSKIIKRIPASLLVLSVAVPLGLYMGLSTAHTYLFQGKEFVLGAQYLVNLPANMLQGITFPDFSLIAHPTSLKFVAMFAIVGSIESLLTVKAMDGLDPYHRKTDMNRDLLAVGAGNVLAGLIGGLPMIAEVVRSSANISNGAKTRWANFFHGCILLIFVGLVPQLLHYIPLSALAAMLIFTGYRLASPREFQGMYIIGKEQFLIFFITMFVTLATDLLLGVVAGIAVKIIFEMIVTGKSTDLFRASVSIKQEGYTLYMDILKPAVFTNYLAYKKHFEALPKGKKIVLNFSQARLIDHTFRENLHQFEYDYHLSGGTIEVEGLDYHAPMSEHPLAMMRISKVKQVERTLVLSSRQIDLQRTAHKEHADFHPEQMFNRLRLKVFPFFKGAKIRKMENRIIKKTAGVTFETCDVAFTETDMAQRRYEISVMLIHHCQIELPDMVLQKESMMDKYTKSGSDINFESHSKFSRYYYLKGREEADIRAFFTEEILTFFENYTNYELEIRHNIVLVHTNKRLLSMPEIKEILAFGEAFMQAVAHSKRETLAHA